MAVNRYKLPAPYKHISRNSNIEFNLDYLAKGEMINEMNTRLNSISYFIKKIKEIPRYIFMILCIHLFVSIFFIYRKKTFFCGYTHSMFSFFDTLRRESFDFQASITWVYTEDINLYLTFCFIHESHQTGISSKAYLHRF